MDTDIDTLQATHHLQKNLKKLHIHSSLHLLKVTFVHGLYNLF